MRLDGSDTFRRRPASTAATNSFRKTIGATTAGRRRKRTSDGDRAAILALVGLVFVVGSMGCLVHLIFGRGGGGGDGGGDGGGGGVTNKDTMPHADTKKAPTSAETDAYLKMWKPRSLRTTSQEMNMELGSAMTVREKAAKSANAKESRHHDDESIYRPRFDEAQLGYDIYNCPSTPPPDYPRGWSATKVLQNWNPNDVTTLPPSYREIYHSLCVFDYQTQYNTAVAYRNAEKPFVLRNDPKLISVAKRWGDPEYLHKAFGDTERVYTERSPVNHFMFYNSHKRKRVKHWKRPENDVVAMTYGEWMERALERDSLALQDSEMASKVELLRERRALVTVESTPMSDDEIVEDEDTDEEKRLKWYYFRATAFLEDVDKAWMSKFLYEELPFFDPRKRLDSEFYIVEPEEERGINCRFGMRGVVAANHYDLSRNMIALLGGERRYVIAHPNQCSKMDLLPPNHPSGRHTPFDWANPTEWDMHPNFKEALVNEVVLRAGEVLYLPTSWFHYIVNLSMNFQCNARSGITHENADFIRECGFDPRD